MLRRKSWRQRRDQDRGRCVIPTVANAPIGGKRAGLQCKSTSCQATRYVPGGVEAFSLSGAESLARPDLLEDGEVVAIANFYVNIDVADGCRAGEVGHDCHRA